MDTDMIVHRNSASFRRRLMRRRDEGYVCIYGTVLQRLSGDGEWRWNGVLIHGGFYVRVYESGAVDEKGFVELGLQYL